MEGVVQQLGEQIRAAAAAGGRLRIRGGGSKDFYGNAPTGEVLDTRSHSGIVAYEPTELVITARAGSPLGQIEATLAGQHQMLAFEPPHFGGGATIGGCIAAGLAGPGRAAYGYSFGAVRDFVLGAKLLDGRAQLLQFGGTVMKNVAGYDVSRLLAGSMGTLGLITEVSIKVLPMPVTTETRDYELREAAALRSLADWGRQPLPISASCWHDDVLRLRLAGAAAAVRAAVARLGGTSVADEEANRYWQALRDQTLVYFSGTTPLWRCSLPVNADALAMAGPQLIEWGGALRWLRSTAPASEIRARVSALGGHATLFRSTSHPGDNDAGAYHALTPAVAAIHLRLIGEFDPHGVFDTGRLLQGYRHANHTR
jgi:glycolate oxidase FAD binding subunit